MGTGIVSIALSLDGERTLSRVWMWLTVAAFLALVALTVDRITHDRAGFLADAREPAALTMVAATAVLGSRLGIYGWSGIAAALLGVATAVWVPLAWPRRLPPRGASFLVTVAPQSLAALAAELAAVYRSTWLIYPAVAVCAVGLVLYPLALRRFDLRELLRGAGDHWVSGGALAISALSTSLISIAAAHVHTLHGAVPVLHAASVVIWALAIILLAAVLVTELLSPRVGYHDLRWSTVFPVGMYAAASFAVARVAKLPALHSFAMVWTWLAVAVWVVVAGGMFAHR